MRDDPSQPASVRKFWPCELFRSDSRSAKHAGTIRRVANHRNPFNDTAVEIDPLPERVVLSKLPRPRQTIGRKYPCASYQRDEDGRLRFALRSQYSFERGGADKGFTDANAKDCAVEPIRTP